MDPRFQKSENVNKGLCMESWQNLAWDPPQGPVHELNDPLQDPLTEQ